MAYGTDYTVDEMGFIQLAKAEILAAAARGEIDLNVVARQELANRGVDWNGKWIGFEKAKALAECLPVRRADGTVVPVSVPKD
jgi:hypothetical protein